MSVEVAQSAPPLRTAVSEEIRALLGRRDISKLELARRINRSHTYVWRRLSGDVAWDLDDLQRIATALGVNVVDLIPRPDGGHLVSSPVDPLAQRVVATVGETRARRAVRLPRQRRPADALILRDLMGHASVVTTQGYAHVTSTQRRRAVASIDALLREAA